MRVFWGVIFALCLMPRASSAQALVDAVYADVKSVIVDLIEAEAAESVVPQIICRLHPSVHLYFGATLSRIHTRQYSGIGAAVIGDVSGLLRDATLRALLEKTSAGGLLQSSLARKDLGDAKAHTAAWADACATKTRAASALDAPALTQALYTGDFETLYAEECSKSGGQPAAAGESGTQAVERRVACELAEGVGRAVVGEAAPARLRLLRAVAALVNHGSGQAEPASEGAVARTTGRLENAIRTRDPARLVSGAELDAVEKALEKEIAEIAQALRPLVPQGGKASGFLSTLIQAFETVCAVADAGGEKVCTDDWWQSLKGLEHYFAAASRDDLLAILHTLVEQAAAALDARSAAADARQTATSTAQQTAAGGQDAGSEPATNGAPDGPGLRLAEMPGEYAVPTGPAGKRRTFARFFLVVVSYALEARGGAVPSQVSREALRSAAVEALRSTGDYSGGGVDRGAWSTNIIIPQPSLNLAISAGHVNDGDSAFRTPVGLDMLNLKWRLVYYTRIYAALNLSLVDVLGPLSELALSAADIKDAEKAWGNLFSPRVELMFGVPVFSRHLVGTIGARYRLCVPHGTAEDFTYECGSGDSDGDGSKTDDLRRHLELGVGVKYLF